MNHLQLVGATDLLVWSESVSEFFTKSILSRTYPDGECFCEICNIIIINVLQLDEENFAALGTRVALLIFKTTKRNYQRGVI